uniref:Uncharacterized protein n=1 Tax=Anguilla anguilla TaxID=7936 RepID=A0A0E9QWE8_ANGAN
MKDLFYLFTVVWPIGLLEFLACQDYSAL